MRPLKHVKIIKQLEVGHKKIYKNNSLPCVTIVIITCFGHSNEFSTRNYYKFSTKSSVVIREIIKTVANKAIDRCRVALHFCHVDIIYYTY